MTTRLKKLRILLVAGLCMLSGCIKEDLSDCPGNCPGLILRYRYDLNMDYTDKFVEKVENLQSYIFDQDGILRDTLLPFVEAGMITPDFERRIDIGAGTYTILTWAGSDKYYGHYFMSTSNSNVPGLTPDVVIGQTRLEDLRLFLRNNASSGTSDQVVPCEAKLRDLYHGLVQQVTVKSDELTVVTTPLVKNTNTIRIRITGLSKLNSSAVSEDFDMNIRGNNGHYRYDNNINEQSAQLIYTPCQTRLGSDTLMTDIRTLRLMKPDSDPFNNGLLQLDITYKPTGLVICRNLNLVDLILSTRIPARDSQGNFLTDGLGNRNYVLPTLEYLDRQDLFELEFKITEDNAGILQIIVYVNGWQITNIYPI